MGLHGQQYWRARFAQDRRSQELIEAAALRLHSFYTAVERSLLREETQIDLQAYLRFHHLVRNLYSDELRAEPIALLIRDLPAVWRKLSEDLDGFREWLATMAQGEDTPP